MSETYVKANMKLVKLQQCNESWRCNICGLFCLSFYKKTRSMETFCFHAFMLLLHKCIQCQNTWSHVIAEMWWNASRRMKL